MTPESLEINYRANAIYIGDRFVSLFSCRPLTIYQHKFYVGNLEIT